MKFKKWLKKHKQTLYRLFILVLCLVAISCVILSILFYTGVLAKNETGRLEFNDIIFEKVKNEWWFPLLFLFLQILMSVGLCFLPGMSMMFITAGAAMFSHNESWKAFLLCFAGVIISSIGMDLLGRIGGSRIVIKLIGKDEYDRAYKLVQTKGITYIPIMYLLPIFPDDAICMIAGTLKFKFWIHLLDILLCRGIGVATIVFGFQLIPFESFKTPQQWITFILDVAVLIYILFKVANWIDKKVSKHMQLKAKIEAKK